MHVRRVKRVFNNDEILELLAGTPAVLVPALGPDRFIKFLGGTGVLSWGPHGSAYGNISESDGYLFFTIGNMTVSGGLISDGTLNSMPDFFGNDVQSNFVDFAAGHFDNSATYGVASSSHGGLAEILNQPLVLNAYNSLGALTGGDPANRLTVTALYGEIDLI